MYLLLVNHGCEGWTVHEYTTEKELNIAIMEGFVIGYNKFKIAKELDISIIEKEDK